MAGLEVEAAEYVYIHQELLRVMVAMEEEAMAGILPEQVVPD